jgi:exopolyphosphatase/guanosine-5'-triphosphate,3'-diphosphate pyrophosphatase
MSMPRYASLDVGSNTVRLLIAERIEGGKIQPLRVERRVTRLGGNFSKEGELDEAAMERTLGTLAVFADLLKKERVRGTLAVATGVLREAKNGKVFIQRVFEHTGLSLRLVSGEEEGCLMLKGVLGSLADKTPTRMVADVGGWSTEILWVEGDEPKRIRSVPLGVVALAEKFLRNDPPQPEELEYLEMSARRVLREIREWFEREGLPFEDLHPHLLGTAGTMTTLAAIDQGLQVYDPQKISGHRIRRPDLEKIYLYLRSLPLRERRNVSGLEKGREDLIVAGAAVVLNLLEAFDLETLVVVDSGLLEGVLLDGISRIP